MRRARMSTIFALPWAVSVTIPACDPVSEIASCPRSWIAIAHSEQEMRSPTEISMSSSRAFGFAEISCASRTRSSVESPIAESTATTRFPASRAATSRCPTAFKRSTSATEVPPNFMTTVPARLAVSSAARAGSASYSVVAMNGSLGRLTTSPYGRSEPVPGSLRRRTRGLLRRAGHWRAELPEPVRAAGRRGRRPSPLRSCSDSSRARPP